jgi:hypothetical protein
LGHRAVSQHWDHRPLVVRGLTAVTLCTGPSGPTVAGTCTSTLAKRRSRALSTAWCAHSLTGGLGPCQPSYSRPRACRRWSVLCTVVTARAGGGRRVRRSACCHLQARKEVEDVCRALTDAHVSATAYHAGMTPTRRSQALANWQSGSCQASNRLQAQVEYSE